ncbi:hypothetical protein DYB25_007458 [Aphanomyces astaci]|uniref:START domain-containing protein n=1 Tax=Aphanomyces astaci TaxID=112090 RepID=A0A397ARV5_APHAT|nr:hypothetical protein DYB36_005659 [Aphanomyces astaci]RHY37752.1 hypothetical protein DYB25_007458 [Aphanomyces astaci]RHY45774.1 hypothetical protein DYB34_010857 [Aphanomyces astaci]
MQVQRLQRSVYALEVMLGKAKRQHHSHDGALPWEDVAKALQDDMLEHVREHRVMRQHVEQHRRLCNALQAWIHTMFPPERTLSSELGTWRNCYLFQGSDDARHQAQTWMVQQAYHNTRRAMSTFAFPDTMETCVDVAVTVDDNRMTIQGAVQCTFPHSLHKLSRALWVVENTFTDYVRDRRMPTRSQVQVLDDVRVIYHREQDPSPRQRIQKNSLHGQIEDRDATTTVFRTIVHDEAFPSQSATEWILDSSEWYVAERVGPTTTRLRALYTMQHPETCTGTVPMETLANAMQIPIDERMRERLCARLQHGHARQRRLYLAFVEKVLLALVEIPKCGEPKSDS